MNRAAEVLTRRPSWRTLLFAAAFALAAALLLGLAQRAGASAITPESSNSPNAHNIDTLYKIVLYIGLAIFIGVEGALGYALIRFRARRGAVAAQIRGNTRLEVGWTAGAALILLVLAIITFVKLASIEDPSNSTAAGVPLSAAGGALYATADRRLPPNGKSLNIVVTGQQFVWRYTYPFGTNPDGLDDPYSYEVMVVPTGVTVTLDVTATDVVHSWWIPQLGGKVQAIPGYHNYTWFRIDKPGIYRGQCATLCGRLHAAMTTTVKALPPNQFDAWAAQQKRQIALANQQAQVSRAQQQQQPGPATSLNP